MHQSEDQIDDQRDRDLDAHDVLSGAEEPLDLEVVFNSAEEQLDLSARLVEVGDVLRRTVEVVGDESQGAARADDDGNLAQGDPFEWMMPSHRLETPVDGNDSIGRDVAAGGNAADLNNMSASV